MPNLLFIADVIGSPGRDVLRALLPGLKRRLDVHLVICNCENAAAGFGLTRDVARELFDAGVDVLTGGNHLWDKKDAMDYLADEPRLVRPANLPPGAPGEGWRVFKAVDGTAVGVVNLLGRVFMKEADDPFRAADVALEAKGGDSLGPAQIGGSGGNIQLQSTTITFNGTGTATAPQLLEAMSQDRGNGGSGFDGNFAYFRATGRRPTPTAAPW